MARSQLDTPLSSHHHHDTPTHTVSLARLLIEQTYGPDDVHLARHSPASRMHAMLTWILAWQEDSEGARLWPPVAGEASDVSSGLGTAAAAAAGDLHTLPQAAAAPPPAGEAADMATQQQQQQHQRHRLRRFEGGYNVEALDSVLDSAFTVHDVLGVRGRPHYPHGGALHHYQRIASRQDAKIGLKELSAR